MDSHATLQHWWERLRVSWWLVPSGCVVGAIGLSVGAQVLDERLGDGLTPSWAQFRGSTDGARSVLSAIAASMMTFAGLVFSITVLVLQLASTQFSPRVLRHEELRRQRRLLDIYVEREFDTVRERDLAREPSHQGHGPLSEQAEIDAAH